MVGSGGETEEAALPSLSSVGGGQYAKCPADGKDSDRGSAVSTALLLLPWVGARLVSPRRGTQAHAGGHDRGRGRVGAGLCGERLLSVGGGTARVTPCDPDQPNGIEAFVRAAKQAVGRSGDTEAGGEPGDERAQRASASGDHERRVDAPA